MDVAKNLHEQKDTIHYGNCETILFSLKRMIVVEQFQRLSSSSLLEVHNVSILYK